MRDGKPNWLFLDMNAYFASVEQQVCPELRGRPTAVVPVSADTTCCIAASYEAKRHGVKTGTKVAEAKRLCPDINLMPARPALYVEYHNKIVEAVNTVLPVDEVHSVDEMSCRLIGRERNPDYAVSLAKDIKQAIKEQAGDALLCSVGIAPNRFLSKVASNLQKPDGLSVIKGDELPEKLYPLSLSDLPGIGRAMEARLNLYGVTTVEQLCALSKAQCHGIWHSVVGKRWWHLLRGEDMQEVSTKRRTVSHSHVLHPQMRTDEGMYSVMIKLIHKAGARLRRLGYYTCRVSIHIDYFNPPQPWKDYVKLGQFQDTHTIIQAFLKMWPERPKGKTPLRVSVVLSDLIPTADTSLPLFSDDGRKIKLAETMDKINERYGLDCVYFGTMHTAKESAPMRISFTSIPDLISEGTAHDRSLLAQDTGS
ncbi:MAG TPA: DNA polymerase [Thermodesulfobacteriota bacterium]|nr:DNA polymerase [Thermodesulfobacteriota bacterium]